ncbi:hypothetical protein AB1Y20_022457 [Prymnesium parvum]|uniref:Uncharacterized protein n=1 Tax=Prymnesium parvum TaxID=97485 RepID=A0AB34JGC9_PRYPA
MPSQPLVIALLWGSALGAAALHLPAREAGGRCADMVGRRLACGLAGAASAVLLPQLPRAQAAETVDAAAAKELRDVSQSLKNVLEQKDAFVKGLLESDPNAPKLPPSVSFTTFQKLEKAAGPEFMEAAIDYAEASRNARDLVKLVKLTKQPVEVSLKEKGKPRTTEIKEYGEMGTLAPAASYAERAVQEILGASLALEAAIAEIP